MGRCVEVVELRLRSVEAKMVNLSALDFVDIDILRFIEDKFDGIAPLGELKSVAVVGGLAPRLRELISIPQLRDMIPQDLLSGMTTALAEKELDARLSKLEALGLIERVRRGEEESVVLTDVGKAIASMGGIPTFRSLREVMAFLSRIRIELPPQPRYPLIPGDTVVVSVLDELELRSNEVAIIVPSTELALFGVDVAPKMIRGPYSDRPELILRSGYAPIVLERGQVVAYALKMMSGDGSEK